ncbi:hypothetical protein FB45DRAFT_1030978 [Roridomyces roridus]|uniref:Uncharacterized protein n=1 Tax=Roridomyces roridus TaxID=1738132 RepID=A0AAD7BLS1_9AGAR|nr:hypothetical protein FB45DRAFT_1030978 [Roridomyces roridus]
MSRRRPKPLHKPVCRDTPGTDIGLDLAKRLIVNEYLIFQLKIYAALALDLCTTRANALDTCLVVNLTMRDADAMAALKAMMNQQERDPNALKMLQVANIEKRPLELATTPDMRVFFDAARKDLAHAVSTTPSLADMGPVVMFIFTDGTNSVGFPFAIDITPMRLARERKPIPMESAMMGKYTVPMDEEHIIETLNNEIRMDKTNRFLLRSGRYVLFAFKLSRAGIRAPYLSY